MPAPDRAERQNVISLAEYRQRMSPADAGPPPPAPCPVAARRPAAMAFVEAIGTPGASLNTINAERARLGIDGHGFSFQNAA